MSAMTGMPMPGGWTMSFAWMSMCGQTWLGTAASFVGMWAVMMVAMMLPSLVPMLQRYRQGIGRTGQMRPGLLTVLAAASYFTVWTALGIAVFPLGAGLAATAMEQPAAGPCRSVRSRGGRPAGWWAAVHPMESASSCLLP
jgi:predicted metal-binding membrane protein